MCPAEPSRSRKDQALELIRTNRLEEAKALCDEVARTENNAGAWYLLSIIHGKLGDFASAERYAKNAIQARAGYVDAQVNLGVAQRMQGKTGDSISSLREAVRLQPDHPEAHFHLGLALADYHQFSSAIEAFRQASRLRPDHAEAFFYLGTAFAASGHSEKAIESFEAVLALKPNYAAAYGCLGNVYAGLKEMEKAVGHYRLALQHRPRDPEILNNLGNALSELNRKDEAIAAYQQALEINPRYFHASHNLGLTHLDQRKASEAIADFKKALEIRSDDPDILRNLGRAWRLKGEPFKAIEHYRLALEQKPDFAEAHFNLAIVYLLLGQFDQGWQEYPWHWRRAGSPDRPCPMPTWTGTDLAGRAVFLCAEQGIGDELFFLRFAAQLRGRGAGTITYQPSPKVGPLLSRVPLLNRIANPDETPADGDCVLSVGDLPRILGHTRADQIPPPLSLTPLPSYVDQMRSRLKALGPGPYLGVTWRAGIKDQDLGLFKESPIGHLAKTLAAIPATVIVLQREPRNGEIEGFSAALGRLAHDFSALNEDLEQMLALLALLDDYIGVSNTNMYLRAGVGKTARVLVPTPPEWRWMAEGKESPWFFGFNIYRQGYDGDWSEAFASLEKELTQEHA